MGKIITNSVIATKLDFLTELVQKHIEKDDRQFDNLDKLFNGNNGTPGYKTRVDRLEQVQAARQWHIKYLWGVMVTFVVGFISKFLLGF